MNMDEIFPPEIPANENTFATFVPWRVPEFKVHAKEGLAHNALSQRGYYEPKAKYELIGNKWVRVWAYVPPTVCRRCDAPFPRSPDHSYTGPKWKREPVCTDCFDEISAEINQLARDEDARARHERFLKN